MIKRKRTNNDLQYITQKTKDRATRTPLKTGSELRCPRRASGSCSTSGTRRVTLVKHSVKLRERISEAENRPQKNFNTPTRNQKKNDRKLYIFGRSKVCSI
jgi:hypothetical protein